MIPASIDQLPCPAQERSDEQQYLSTLGIVLVILEHTRIPAKRKDEYHGIRDCILDAVEREAK